MSSKVGGVSHLIDHGSNGFLFRGGDADASGWASRHPGPGRRPAQGHGPSGSMKRPSGEFSIEATIQRQLKSTRPFSATRPKGPGQGGDLWGLRPR
ncbi:MAG: hypothetical protein ACLUNZ_11215 [Evtepia sp.]